MKKKYVIVPKADAEADFAMLNCVDVKKYSHLRMNRAKNRYIFSLPPGKIPSCFIIYEVFTQRRIRTEMRKPAWRPAVSLLARLFGRSGPGLA